MYTYGKGPFPYAFKEVFGVPYGPGNRLYISDIDCDLRDEFLFFQKQAINVRNKIDYWDEEVDATLWVLNASNELGKVLCANLDQEGDLEIIVPEKVENSIFLNVYTSERKQLRRFFACEGFDRNNDGNWDGTFREMIVLDLDNDGILEIIVAVQSSYDLHPRGIWAFNWKEGKKIWQFETGTQMVDILSADLDGDGLPEIICSSGAPSNGSISNGTDDNHSYIFILDSDGELVWKQERGGIFSRIDVSLVDIDSDGERDIVAFETSGYPKTEIKSKITLMHATFGETKEERTFFTQLRTHDIKDINKDGQPEIILLFENGQIQILDYHLNIILEFNDPQKSDRMLLEDLDNDGKLEVILSRLKMKTIVLDNDLGDVVTVFENGGNLFSVKTNPGQPRRLAIACSDYLFFLDLVKVPLQDPPYFILGFTGLLLLSLFIFFRGRFTKPQTQVEAAFFEATPGGIIFLDKRGKIAFVNQRAQDILELKEKNIKGKPYQDVFHKEMMKNIFVLLEKSQKESWQGVQEIQMKVGGEPKELIVCISTLKDKRGKDTRKLVMIDDVSELVMSQRALAWATVAQQAAHKIKNPLTMMKLAVDRIQSVSREIFGEDAKKLDRYIETNRDQISALLNITDAFMQIANLRPPNFQPTNIKHVIKCVLGKYAESFSNGIELSLDLNENLPNVKADERQLETVFENLLTNALAAMGEKGSLNISASLTQRFQDPGVKSGEKEYAQVEISDTGRGIPREDMDRLFDQFFSRSEGGTGMGLSIVKKIIDDHQGMIQVDSTMDVGTTFTVLIPIWKMEKE